MIEQEIMAVCLVQPHIFNNAVVECILLLEYLIMLKNTVEPLVMQKMDYTVIIFLSSTNTTTHFIMILGY